MIEQAVTETFKVSITLGLLLLAVVSLVFYINKVDKRNMALTDSRIEDLKADNKDYKETLKLALETFSNTTEEFRKINNNINEMKTDITLIKEKIK